VSLKEKTEEVVAEGEANRGVRTPTGVPKRIYDYWLRESNSTKASAIRSGYRKENFCHYWRVVAIWAPLMFLKHKTETLFENRAFQIALVVLAVMLVVGLSLKYHSVLIALGLVVGGAVALAWLLLAGLAGIVSAEDGFNQSFEDEPVHQRIGWALAPVAGLFYLGTKAVQKITPLAKQHPKSFSWTLAALVTLGLAVLNFALGGVTAVAAYALTLAVIYGIYRLGLWGFPLLSDKIESAHDKRVAERVAYFEEHGEYPTREPGRIVRFFQAVGEFIVFVAQVIRVKKWKICPLVDINTQVDSAA
jgi:hypothetical protein